LVFAKILDFVRLGPMTTISRLAGLAALPVVLLGAASGVAADAPAAVETAGRAQLQVCRNWVMFRTCNDYSRVDIPARVAVGDTLYLAFGSNNKSMSFAIAAIRLTDGTCTLYTERLEPGADESEVDKLTVSPCKAAS
jgi:hypothetical protein